MKKRLTALLLSAVFALSSIGNVYADGNIVSVTAAEESETVSVEGAAAENEDAGEEDAAAAQENAEALQQSDESSDESGSEDSTGDINEESTADEETAKDSEDTEDAGNLENTESESEEDEELVEEAEDEIVTDEPITDDSEISDGDEESGEAEDESDKSDADAETSEDDNLLKTSDSKTEEDENADTIEHKAGLEPLEGIELDYEPSVDIDADELIEGYAEYIGLDDASVLYEDGVDEDSDFTEEDSESEDGAACTEEDSESEEDTGYTQEDSDEEYEDGTFSSDDESGETYEDGIEFEEEYETDLTLEEYLDMSCDGSSVYDDDWDRYSSNYAYNHMSSAQKTVWKAMDALCLKALTTENDYKEMWVGFISTSAFSSRTDLKNFLQAYKYSHPEYFFLSSSYCWYDSTNPVIVSWGMYDSMCSGSARAEAKASFLKGINAFKSKIDYSGDENQTFKSITDVICNKVSYVENDYDQSAYSVFTSGKSVCAGYALATELLCNDAGIDCVGVTAPDHAYNKVRINSTWYNSDTTWIDPDSSDKPNYSYYLKSDKVFADESIYHQPDSYWGKLLPSSTHSTDSTYGTAKSAATPSSTVAAPKITVKGSKVTMSCSTSGAKIYYTLDGRKPSCSFSKCKIYKDTFEVSGTKTIKVIAIKDGMKDSKVVTLKFPVSHSITYTLNGGSNNSNNPSKYTWASSGSVKLYDPTRKGYKFAGWYGSSDFTGDKITSLSKSSNKNFTLYAKWSAIKYTVKYNGNSSTSGKMADQTIKYGKTAALTANAFKRKGYKFTGWNLKKDGSGKAYADKASVKNLSSKSGAVVTLYAQWQKVKYTIKYELNGGSNNSANPAKYYVTTATIKLKAPTKKGYTFKGWYTDAAFTKSITQIAKGSSGNKTLYAKWAANKYTIRFNGNGADSGKMSDIATAYNKKAVLTGNSYKRTGYAFKGWNTAKDGSGKSYADKASVKNLSSKSSAVVTLYAQWKRTAYYVSTKGSDSNKGTYAKPFKTIQKALDCVKKGQTVYVMAGTYAEYLTFKSSGTEGNYITLCPLSGATVKLTGGMADSSTRQAINLNGQSYIKIKGFDIGGFKAANAQGIFLNGKEHYVQITNCKIHNIVTTKPKDSANGGANAILLLGEGSTEADAISHITISGNEVYSNTTGYSESVSVAGNCEYVTVKNNKVHDNTNIGIDFYGNAGYCSTASLDQPRNCSASGNTVYNCVSSYADCAGLYVDGARNVKLCGNTVYGCAYGIEVGSEEGYGKDDTTPVTKITVTENTLHDNLCSGIRIGGYSTTVSGTVKNSTISNNTLKNNGTDSKGYSGEINIEKVDGITISGNKIYKENSADKDFPMVVTEEELKSYVGSVKFSGNTYYSTVSTEKIPFNFKGDEQTGITAFNAYTGGSDNAVQL